jgi:predicted RNA-binding protein (virulence factor B family)
MSLVSVEGYKNLKKDTSSGGVVNTDSRGYKAYLETKKVALHHHEEQKQTQSSVVQLQNEINTIKNDMTDIKNILMQLLEKGN